MSDLSKIIHQDGGDPFKVAQDFMAVEHQRAIAFVNNLSPEIRGAAQNLLTTTETALSDAASWAGTAAAQYIDANAGNLETEVANLVSGLLGKTDPTSAAAADVVSAAGSLLIGVVQNMVLKSFGVTIPSPPVLGKAT